MNTAIVTGGNGFIGSHLIQRLLSQGWTVHALGRDKVRARWADRLEAALNEIDDLNRHRNNLHCHATDLTAPDPKIDLLANAKFRSAPTAFHVAGDTRFSPRDQESQWQINVEGTRNVIRALRGIVSRVVHVSTAYVCGDRTGLIREDDLDHGQTFRNSYERSKLDAEALATSLCQKYGVPLSIVRPAIIINHRQSGKASTFTHLNALVEVISRIQDHYGISDGEVVSKRIRLNADPEARPNLAPIDSIIPPLVRIAESPAAAGKTFHLCDPQPQSNAEIIQLLSEAFDVAGKVDLEFTSEIQAPVTRTEEMISRSLRAYAPYLNSRCTFDVSNCRSVVPEFDSHFTRLDTAYLRRVMAFQRRQRGSRVPP